MSDLEIPRVINAAGHLSMLGGGVTHRELARAIGAAVEEVLSRPVDMARLKDELSKRIAAATGAQAGAVTTGAAAGIALSVAACVAGEAPGPVNQVPDGNRKPIVIQSGHDIDFGAPVLQMIRMGGGTPVIAGSRARVTSGDVERSLDWAAALLFIQSHHVKTPARLPLGTCLELAHARGVPVIVDAAAEEDLRAYIEMGADMVIYSGGKALGGLSSSGLVAGRANRIAAVRAQERGIGRAMKVGPEQLVSMAIALEWYGRHERGDNAILDALVEGTKEMPGAEFAVVPDEAGRDIRRLEVRTMRATEVVSALRHNDPPIYVRAHNAGSGRFTIDPRNLAAEDVAVVLEALRKALG